MAYSFPDKLPAGTPGGLPGESRLILVGQPQTNPLLAAVEQRKQVTITDLKPDGFVLKQLMLEGRPAIVVAPRCRTSPRKGPLAAMHVDPHFFAGFDSVHMESINSTVRSTRICPPLGLIRLLCTTAL